MEGRTMRPDSSKSCSHLISLDAVKAALSAGHATDKLSALDDMSFREARIFKVFPSKDGGDTTMDEVTRGAKKKYADHFCNIKKPRVRDIGITCAFEDDGRLHGYITYYTFASDVFGDEIMYAFFHKSMDVVILLVSTKADAHASANQIMHSMAEPTPFGKLCAWCGARSWGAGVEILLEKLEKLRKCPCKTVRYCSKACQNAHWADHRPFCSRGNE
jgi:hypothetical protein